MINFWMDMERFSIYFTETHERFFLYRRWHHYANDVCTAKGPVGYKADSVIDFGNVSFDGSLLDEGYKI